MTILQFLLKKIIDSENMVCIIAGRVEKAGPNAEQGISSDRKCISLA